MEVCCMSEWPASLLTQAQREKLSEGPESQHHRQYRQRVRERTVSGVHDLALLFRHMEPQDIEQAFSPDKSEIEKAINVIQDLVKRFRSSGSISRIQTGFFEIRSSLDDLERINSELNELESKKHDLNDQSTDDETVFSEPTSQQRKQIEDKITRLRGQREDIISTIREEVQDLAEPLSKRYERVQSSEQRFSEIDMYSLPDEYQNEFTEVRQQLRTEVNGIEQAGEIASRSDIESEDRSLLIDHADDLLHSLQSVSLRRDSREHHIVDRLVSLKESLEEDYDRSEFAPGLREDYIDALAFLFKVSEALGTDTQSLTEEALIKMYEKEYPHSVVGHATVNLDVESRDVATERGLQKPPNDRLSSTELRAIATKNPEALVDRFHEGREISEEELRSAFEANLDKIEQELSIEDSSPTVPGDNQAEVPDIIGRDEDGQIILIELRREIDEPTAQRVLDRMEEMVEAYGGEQRVRGLIVAPIGRVTEPTRTLFEENNLELFTIDV